MNICFHKLFLKMTIFFSHDSTTKSNGIKHIQKTSPLTIKKSNFHVNKKVKTIDCSTFVQTLNENQYWHEYL